MTRPTLNRLTLGGARDLTRDREGGPYTEIQAFDSKTLVA
jgi:hypothetical protein